jgi:diguanylate cyclase (GGDEF)-like protein
MAEHDTNPPDRTRFLRDPAGSGDADSPRPAGDALLILIAHPENERLGSQTRLAVGSSVTVGRHRSCGIAYPEVPSLSRFHARVEFAGDRLTVTDLDSTNGSFVNDQRVVEEAVLGSGDRIQFGALHFKLVHEADVEAAYHEAIHQLVTQDGLTEIANRRRFDDELAREFARADRHARPLGLIVFDIDRFKKVNDSLGHLSGDHVLKKIAAVCGQSLRSEQVFARLGGDEFAVICPETGSDGVRTLADRLRASVADQRFDPDMVPDDLRVTCSFGCAELTAGMTAASELLDAADRALYAAKQAGRNRVAVADHVRRE